MNDNLVEVKSATSDTNIASINEIKNNLDTVANLASVAKLDSNNLLFSALPDCCHQTLDTFVAQNDMMVCHQCRRIIKVFRNEPSFDMFMVFCKSKKRLVRTYYQNALWVVSYNASFTS
ncbi:MAG: hypothetical protein KBD78_11420 [Oligoflexales bacterium]|nr:hypothetical protein [Oligoflexales bacterium]